MSDAIRALTPREAAERLNVSYGTVLGLIGSGRLPAFRSGPGPRPRYRIHPAALEHLLLERASRPAAPPPAPSVTRIYDDTFR